MVKYHVLIFFLVAVTFAICEARGGRRNYNTNANVNTNIVGRLSEIPEIREDLIDNDADWPHESSDEGPNSREISNPDEYVYFGPYPEHEVEDDIPPDFDVGFERYDRSRPAYTFDIPRHDGRLGDEVCDDGHNHRYFNDRTPFSGNQPYRRVWNGPPPIVIEPSFPDNNWGHLNPPIIPLRRAYVQPAIGPIPMQNRQPPYFVDRPAPQSLDLRLHQPATSLQADLGSNINSNANLNVIGRRHNANVNSNANIIGHGKYGRLRHSPDAGRESPSYPNYVPKGVPTIRVPAPKPWPPRPWPRPKPHGHDYYDEIVPFGDEHDSDIGGRHGNANVNTNSNVNIMGRRMQPRNRRSAGHQPTKASVTPKMDIEASTTSSRR